MPPNHTPTDIEPSVTFSHRLEVNDGLATREVALAGFSGTTTVRCDARLRDPFSAWWKGYLAGPAPQSSVGKPERIRVVDLFSSVGGLSLGFAEAARSLGLRAQTMLAADVDEEALHVFEANHSPRQTVHRSVRDLVEFRVSGTGSRAQFALDPRLDDEVMHLSGRVDAILAGPPCQGHSTLNNRSRSDDPRNALYLTVPAFAAATGARVVVIENVPNVVNDKQGVVQTSRALLESLGYQVDGAVLSANKLGWAQTRKRYFLVATRRSPAIGLSALENELRHDPLPVSWAIGDLERRPLSDSSVMDSVPNLSQENRERIEWLYEHDAFDLPNEIRPDCHKDGHTYPAVYGRMHWDQPAGTITGGFLTPGRGRFIHPRQPRVLTPREAARIQCFPDRFDFTPPTQTNPSRASVTKWIGDAVPPILGFAAGITALSSL